METITLKIISVMAILTLLPERCFPQKVPGLAYMDIMKTAPRKRPGDEDPAPELPIEIPQIRRYDVMLDYDDDYFEYEDYSQEADAVVTNLERPQKSETLLSTDVTDYALVAIDSDEEVEDYVYESQPIYTEDMELLLEEEKPSRGPNDNIHLPTNNREYQTHSLQSDTFDSDPQMPAYSEEMISEEELLRPSVQSLEYPNSKTTYYGGPDEDYYPDSIYIPDSVPVYVDDYPTSFYSDDYPVNSDHKPSDANRRIQGNVDSHTISDDAFSDQLTTSSVLYPTYQSPNYQGNAYDSRKRNKDQYYDVPSKPTVYVKSEELPSPESLSIPTSTSSARYNTELAKRSSEPSKQKNVLSRYDQRNREEIMYYTGLQQEIEKSGLLSDAIRDVRSREGKMVTFTNKASKTTTTTVPHPDPRIIKSVLGVHPLYKNLPGMLSSSEIKEEPYVHREYQDEKDEYENMYLPARVKSLELTEIDEVKDHFNILVPKSTYVPTDFPNYPSYPGQRIYMPPVTTYKPSQIPKYNKRLKPPSVSGESYKKLSAELPLEHRSDTEYYPRPQTGKSKAKYYHPSSPRLHTPKPYISSASKHRGPEDPHTSKQSSIRYHKPTTPSPAHTNDYNKNIRYATLPQVKYAQSSPRPYLKTTLSLRSYYKTTDLPRAYYKTTDSPRTYYKTTDLPRAYYKTTDTPRTYYKTTDLPRTYYKTTDFPRHNYKTTNAPRTYYKTVAPAFHYRPTVAPRLYQPKATTTPKPYHKITPPPKSHHKTAVTTRPNYKTTVKVPPLPYVTIKPYTRQNSRQPTSDLYEEAGVPSRPSTLHLEENVRQKRGPDMELAIDSRIRFPKFGYNIDQYFEDFPSFGFFDYSPSREVA